VVALWGFAPQSMVDTWWTLPIIALGITAFIQTAELVLERHASWRINRQELLTDMFYVAFGFGVIGWLSDTLVTSPMRDMKATLGIATPWLSELPFVVQAACVVLLIEFGQYWMHRWMHNWTPLWLTHAPHHHITQLNAMKGAVGNPIELFLISLSVVALFDFDKAALFAGFSTMGVISSFAHANVRADPPIWYSFFFTTIRHHSLHHTALSYEDTRCNYGNSVILFDRLFGTYREGESEIVGQDERRRLSIKEQFLFPFQGWLARRTVAARQ
jgi:sterol desaturase/sphingolipid hydroxylase (fatty acid hydroxylase superfamily)